MQRQPRSRNSPTRAQSKSWLHWLFQPRTLVFAILVFGLLLGGGARLRRAIAARRAARRLSDGEVAPDEIEAAAQHGRAALPELMDLLGPGVDATRRMAAARALSRLWAADQLVAEEEQAVVARGHDVHWRARRVYPRALTGNVLVRIEVVIPVIEDTMNPSVKSANLELSARLRGARRLAYESPSPWQPSTGPLAFDLNPADFPGRGPHLLELHSAIRTRDLSSLWQFELPTSSFRIEFDDHLRVDAIFTLHDADREALIQNAVSLDCTGAPANEPYHLLDETLALARPLVLGIGAPLPCDMVHQVELEFEGHASLPCGTFEWVTSDSRSAPASMPLTPVPSKTRLPLPTGWHKVRAILTPDAHQAWINPDTRALWPGRVVTNWVDLEILRR